MTILLSIAHPFTLTDKHDSYSTSITFTDIYDVESKKRQLRSFQRLDDRPEFSPKVDVWKLRRNRLRKLHNSVVNFLRFLSCQTH